MQCTLAQVVDLRLDHPYPSYPRSAFPSERLGGILDLLADGTISNQTAKTLLRDMFEVRT